MVKMRVDKLMVERGLAPSREKAVALVMAGCVFAEGAKILKPGQMLNRGLEIALKGEDHPYVGRGGVKLAHALTSFGIDVAGKVCMDVGASTGGFTDCLLQNGAARVYAVDVGYGQLAWKIAKDERVVVIERTNIRKIDLALIPDKIDVVVADVSFISLTLVLPHIGTFLSSSASIIALIKPQFEVGRGLVGKGGIVKDPKLHEMVTQKIKAAGISLGWNFVGVIASPILGAKGNKEFLVCFSAR